MNRIYQGKVTKVEILKPGSKGKSDENWEPLDNWREALWQHHQLFQDAVNYYTLALSAMATVINKGDTRGKAIENWRKEVKNQWLQTVRKAERYEGPNRRIATLLGLDPVKASYENCAEAIMRASKADSVLRANALLQLLDETDKTDLSQLCVARLPFLCSAAGSFDGTSRAVSSEQEVKRQALAREYRDMENDAALQKAPNLDIGLFLTQPPTQQAQGSEAKRLLEGYWERSLKKYSGIKAARDKFEKLLNSKGDNLYFPKAGRKPSGLYPIAAVFKFCPCKETLEAFRDATRTLCEARDRKASEDALAKVRVDNAPVFEYFTNIAFHRDAGKTQRAAWFEFDLAAFVEAIKAPHRYYQDTQAREVAVEALRKKLAAIKGKGTKSDDDGREEESESFGFTEDVRIDLIRELVEDPDKGLAYLAEEESADGKAVEYTIQQRTLRGWNAVRDRWRALAAKGAATPEKLWEIVASEQGGHREDFGSAALYKKLAEPRYHPVWRDKGTREWHADDPLHAWMQYTDLRSELADKERAIRFTPADPTHSPRFFIFPKKSAAGGRWGSSHLPGWLQFTAGIALRYGDRWRPQMARFSYAAPRLYRDELRNPGDQDLKAVPWLQPMMKAIGLPEPTKLDFSNCRVVLQPSSPNDMHLSFPVEIDPKTIIDHLRKNAIWAKQFNVIPDGKQFRVSTLRWRHEKRPAKVPEPWYESINSFMCLSVDLGQRQAGAYALIEARANGDFGTRPSREIGETPGKKWRAALAATGILRLPGEDQETWRARYGKDGDKEPGFAIREELHGGRGRMPRPFETDEFRELLKGFLGKADAVEFISPSQIEELSFPEQNDKLLVAARRAQSRLARLHRWCWLLGDESMRQKAADEIREALQKNPAGKESWLTEIHKDFALGNNDPRLREKISFLLETHLRDLPELLIKLANRILPLRGRSWAWVMHPDATNGNRVFLLVQTRPKIDSKERPTWLRGQRGLSMERIGQIEELRRRFQSLNQSMRRDIGGKPPIRRDESVPDPCPDLLTKLEHLKEQRVDQTAHLILAEALGVRLAKPPADKKALKAKKDQHGTYEKRRKPVDFIVIEDLSRYRASQGRSPSENSRLMKWCHRAVRDKLRELCEPFGLPVLETPAAYTSRFCSRTGVPGFRAVEVTAGFENKPPWCWLKDKQRDGRPTVEAEFIKLTAEKLNEEQTVFEEEWRKRYPGQTPPRRTLLIPQGGGPIFVPATEYKGKDGLSAAVVQADINAAINLGLRAISDPRIWEIHPRLRTERTGGEAKGRRGRKSKKEEGAQAEQPISLRAKEKRKYGDKGPVLNLITESGKGGALVSARNPNYFYDAAGLAMWDRAKLPDPITSEPVIMASGKSLWGEVKALQWKRCSEINETRMKKWRDSIKNG